VSGEESSLELHRGSFGFFGGFLLSGKFHDCCRFHIGMPHCNGNLNPQVAPLSLNVTWILCEDFRVTVALKDDNFPCDR